MIPLPGSKFVGRTEEILTLRRTLQGVHDGSGHVVAITGEAGIDKSRLAGEAATAARELGFKVLDCRCYEQDSSYPYSPLADLCERWLGGMPEEELTRHWGRQGAALTTLVPDVATTEESDREFEPREIQAALLHTLRVTASPNPCYCWSTTFSGPTLPRCSSWGIPHQPHRQSRYSPARRGARRRTAYGGRRNLSPPSSGTPAGGDAALPTGRR